MPQSSLARKMQYDTMPSDNRAERERYFRQAAKLYYSKRPEKPLSAKEEYCCDLATD